MRFSLHLRILLVFGLSAGLGPVVGSSAARAEDHGGGHDGGGGGHEAPEGGGHAAPEGEGHEAAGGGGHGGESKSTLAPWVEVENKIQELHSKIKSKQSTITHLLEEKDHLPNHSPHLKTTVEQIVREHKELRSLVEEYDKNVSLLKYRFPERNAKMGRTYDRFEVKSVEDMEQALGIDGKLTRNLHKIRKQYKPSESSPAADEHKTAHEGPAPASHKEPSIDQAGSIILHK